MTEPSSYPDSMDRLPGFSSLDARRPGDSGTVLFLKDELVVEATRLPRAWLTLTATDPSSLLEQFPASDIVFISTSPQPSELTENTIRFLFGVNRSKPVFSYPDLAPLLATHLSTNPTFPVRFVDRGVNVGPPLLDAISRPVLIAFRQALLAVGPPPAPLLCAAIRTFLDQRPFVSHRTSTQSTPGQITFRRTVTSMAASVGCSTGYLRSMARAAGINLQAFVRWGTLLHAATQFLPGDQTWTDIARRLGFSSLSAFSHFCVRTSGMGPRGLEKRPWRELLTGGLHHTKKTG